MLSGPDLDLPQPGSPMFTLLLVEALAHAPELRGWEPDGGLVAVLLMALIARQGGVVIDVLTGRSHMSQSSMSRAVRITCALAESVFGLDSRVLHLSSSSMTSDASLETFCEALVITGLEDAPPPVQIKLRNEIARAEKSLERAPLLLWVRDDDRHDAPVWLLDLFACSTPLAVDDLEPPPIGLSRTALVPNTYISDLRYLLALTHIHPPLETHISNLIAALAMNPEVTTALTARATAALAVLTQTHRLLAGDFDVPSGWRIRLHEYQRAMRGSGDSRIDDSAPFTRSARRGLGGGPGGVATWNLRAGEPPTATAMLGPGAEAWYCMPENVAGAWELAVRHRVRVRRPGEGILYAIDGSAQERAERARRLEQDPRHAARRRRTEIDDALEEILLNV